MIRCIALGLCTSSWLTFSFAQDKGGTGQFRVTTGDQKKLFAQAALVSEAKEKASGVIVIDRTKAYQTVEGFGYTLTGGSAALLHQLPQSQRSELLKELFGPAGMGISYLRISIGASDLDDAVFSYDDLPEGMTDVPLAHFNLSRDTVHLIPLLQEILTINPKLKIMGSPWSAPVWMKDNRKSKGGSLLPAYYEAYAQYFVRYLSAMRSLGIRIDALTPQNEPLHPGNNPSMYMPAEQQRDFISGYLGPAFEKAGIDTKIIVYDHNCNKPEYPLTILNDPKAKKYVAGSAFHLYEGEITALSSVHEAHPDKGLYFTEQWTGAKGDFDGDLFWHVRHVIIGSMRNWSRTALEWNLANDPNYDPHTPGGCTECKGALTIDQDRITRNVSYYIIAHAAKFVVPGSVRIGSQGPDDLPQVAFMTPQGRQVVILLNEGKSERKLTIQSGDLQATVLMPAGAVGTLVL